MISSASRPRWALGITLALVLASVYLLTYTAKPIVSDETQYADAADGLLYRGQPLLDVTMWERMPSRLPEREAVPLRQSEVERGFLWAAMPWVWSAEELNGVGVSHALFTFNAVITPLLAIALFAWAYRLTGSGFAAGAAMLTLGLLTGFWPYAHTFFREPLTALLLVTGAGLWWRGGWGQGVARYAPTALGAVMLVGAFMVKESVIFAAPGLLMLLIPAGWWARRGVRITALVMLGTVVGLILALIYTPLLAWLAPLFPSGYLFSEQFPVSPETTRVALHSYLLAAGGAFWATSPILLLSIPGAVMLWRRGDARLVTASALILMGTALGYALLRGEGSIGGNWFGGTMWPHRFLLPAIPFVVLLTAPIWDMLGKRKNPTLAIITLLFGIYSLLWAGFGAVFPWDVYGFFTFDQSGGLSYWLPGLNVLSLSRVSIYAGLVGHFPTDIAWLRAGVGIYAVSFGICAGLAAFLVIIESRVRRKFGIWVGISLLVLALPSLTYSGLRALYTSDPYFQAERPDLHAAADLMRQRVPSDGVVLINQPDTGSFWANSGKGGARTLAVLPYHPGEMDNPDDTPPTAAQLLDPTSLLGERVAPWIEHVAARQSRLWLLMDRGLDTPWSVRPVERFMAERYSLVREDKLSAHVRLLEYVTTPAPTSDPSTPPVEIDQTFTNPVNGESITLRGFTQPQLSGDALTVSLAWTVDATPTQDVTVAVFFVNADNVAARAQGIDSWLGGTFKTSTLIPPGGAVWDNRGMILPPEIPSGRYQVWVKVYTVDYATGDITLWMPPTDPTGEGAVVLPVDITFGAE